MAPDVESQRLGANRASLASAGRVDRRIARQVAQRFDRSARPPGVTTMTDWRRWLVAVRRSLATRRIAQQNGSRQTRVYRGFGAFDDPSPTMAPRRALAARARWVMQAIRDVAIRAPPRSAPIQR